MELNYNSFIQNINNFNAENYIKKINIDIFNKFYEYYLVLDEEENKKYNANVIKFKKSINEQKNHKYVKINREPEEYKKLYDINNIQDEDQKVAIMIRSYLNKLSNETYERISTQLIDELLSIENIKIFEILSKEITNKCIFDNKYRNLYINLCHNIWNNKQIHYNLIKMKKEGYDYYWYIDIADKNKIQYNGPYENESSVKNDIFKKINFKRYFLNYIQNLFNNKNIDISSLDDESFFDEKKKLLSLCELISILFIDKHINFNIINITLINLLHLNNNLDEIKEIEFELIYQILKYISENNIYYKFTEFNTIFNEYIKILINCKNSNVGKRSIYFIDENINILNLLVKNNKNNNIIKKDKFTNKQNDKIISVNNNISFIDSLIKQNIEQSSKLLKESKTIENDIKIIINLILDKTKKYDILFITTILLKNKNNYLYIIEKIINEIINDYEDIVLDIPDIKVSVINLIKNLELNETFINECEMKLNNYLDSDSDSDSDFDLIR